MLPPNMETVNEWQYFVDQTWAKTEHALGAISNSARSVMGTSTGRSHVRDMAPESLAEGAVAGQREGQ